MRISNTLKNDLGNYTVVAENKAGKAQTSCQLRIDLQPNVDETPLINPDAFKFLDNPPSSAPQTKLPDDEDKKRFMPPNVIVPLSNARINEGESVLLACKIDGFPKPKVKEEKNS